MRGLKLDFFRNLEGLPSPPFQLLKVLDEVGRATTQDFNACQMIQNDPSMACRILKVANTRLYGYPGKILSLNQAAGLLGPAPIKNIVLTAPMLERFGGNNTRESQLDYIRPWQHMAITAMIAGCLGKLLPQMEPDICYTAGLIHDIGKIALMVHHPDLLSKIILLAQQKDTPLIHAEYAVIGCSHASIAAEMTSAWGLPDLLTGALKNFPNAGDSTQSGKLAGTLYLADYLANDWGFDDGMEQNKGLLPRELLTRLGATAQDLETWKPELLSAAEYAAED